MMWLQHVWVKGHLGSLTFWFIYQILQYYYTRWSWSRWDLVYCLFWGKKYTLGPRFWNVPVLVNTGTFLVYQYCLPENVIFTFFRTCWCYSEAYNTGMQKRSSIVQYSCTNIWDFKYIFSIFCFVFLFLFCFVFSHFVLFCFFLDLSKLVNWGRFVLFCLFVFVFLFVCVFVCLFPPHYNVINPRGFYFLTWGCKPYQSHDLNSLTRLDPSRLMGYVAT